MAELKPARVFEQFAKINQIPRPSKHEEQMIAYLKKFGADHGLETIVDETGNVLIRKPATKGYENRATTILQSHQRIVFLVHHSTLSDQGGIYVHLTYIVNYHCEFNPLPIIQNSIQKGRFTTSEISGKK